MKITYDVENPMHSIEVKEKVRRTNLKRYGVSNPFQSTSVKEKSKQTCLERFGVENVMQSSDIREIAKRTNIEKYGVENPFQSNEVKEKIAKRREYLLSRPELETIRKYKRKYKIKIGQGWVRKPDEFIQNLLKDLTEKYGEI
jgi:hypothetical protein